MTDKKTKRSNMAIWKIDSNHPLLKNLSSDEKIEKVIETHNNKGGQKFLPVQLTSEKIDSKLIRLFHKDRSSRSWENFIGGIVVQNEANEDIFYTRNNDFLCFIFDEDDVFLITAGAGYHAIQEFIDDSFPLEVSKKIFTGEFSRAETRVLTGVAYAKSENFRRNYSFSRQEAFGKVWKKLAGQIDPDVIKKSPELSLVIDPKRKTNAEMKSSFTFRKSVTLEEVVQLTSAIQKLPQITDERKKRFRFLDTLKEIRTIKEKERLWKEMHRKLHGIVSAGDFHLAKDFDLCHPSEVFDFLAGRNFKISGKLIQETDPPTADEVLKLVKDENMADLSSVDQFQETFTKIQMTFQLDEEDKRTLSSSLSKYFHGEIEVGGKHYFLVDGKWYQPIGTFLDSLLEDFTQEVFDDGILTKKIPFDAWKSGSENDFNKEQAKKDGFYYGDKVFLISGKGKIELFDLLYVLDKKLYIIQVKDGFGASVRDACSQLQVAAETIEEDRLGDKVFLSSYYDNWKKEGGNDLSKDDFLKLFQNKDRIYVLACSTNQSFIKDDFSSKRLGSHIAQFEILGIKHDFNARGFIFNLEHVSKS